MSCCPVSVWWTEQESTIGLPSSVLERSEHPLQFCPNKFWVNCLSHHTLTVAGRRTSVKAGKCRELSESYDLPLWGGPLLKNSDWSPKFTPSWQWPSGNQRRWSNHTSALFQNFLTMSYFTTIWLAGERYAWHTHNVCQDCHAIRWTLYSH